MKSKEIKEFVESGYLRVNVLFEVVGNPKEHVEAMIKKVMEGVSSEKKIKVVSEEYGSAEDAGDGLWGTFCEADLLLKDVNVLSWLAFNFSPASVELIEPKQVILKDKQMTDFMGELLSQLHQNNLVSIQAKSDAKGLLLSLNALMRNAILFVISSQSKSAEEISRILGVDEKGAKSYLDAMIKEKSIVESEGLYSKA